MRGIRLLCISDTGCCNTTTITFRLSAPPTLRIPTRPLLCCLFYLRVRHFLILLAVPLRRKMICILLPLFLSFSSLAFRESPTRVPLR